MRMIASVGHKHPTQQSFMDCGMISAPIMEPLLSLVLWMLVSFCSGWGTEPPTQLLIFSFIIMILNVASDIHTRQLVWVATHPEKGQQNSHTCDVSVDGLSSVEWSGLMSVGGRV